MRFAKTPAGLIKNCLVIWSRDELAGNFLSNFINELDVMKDFVVMSKELSWGNLKRTDFVIYRNTILPSSEPTIAAIVSQCSPPKAAVGTVRSTWIDHHSNSARLVCSVETVGITIGRNGRYSDISLPGPENPASPNLLLSTFIVILSRTSSQCIG